MDRVRLFIRLARPLFLLGGALVYATGVGIARYLGTPVDWGLYLLGQAWVTLLQLSTHFLNEYFDSEADADNPNRTPFSGGSGALGSGELPRSTALVAAYACLALVASLTVLLIRDGHLSPPLVLIMVLGVLGAMLYSTPPVRLATTGYGELTTSILVANLVPAFAFILQTGELHRLVAMTTFPLTALHLAMMLAFELPDYASDIKHEKRTLMVRLGWQLGMQLHNLLILTAYLLFGLALFFDLPSFVVWPTLLGLPFGLLQIWQMRRIAEGARPNWTALTLVPVALFAFTTYLVTFAYWTH